ncbi:MAG: VOC family protein [Gammaproteobacteria bacterium]|jgi:hypothetical protein
MSNTLLNPAIPQLPTGDIEKTAEFFVSKLNFNIVEKFPEYKHLIIRRGSAEIHFWQAPTESEAKAIAVQSSCYIRVVNIEILFAEFMANSAPFCLRKTKQPWGMYEMQINDPYGNAIRFGEEYIEHNIITAIRRTSLPLCKFYMCQSQINLVWIAQHWPRGQAEHQNL